jgi:hypothetical protein
MGCAAIRRAIARIGSVQPEEFPVHLPKASFNGEQCSVAPHGSIGLPTSDVKPSLSGDMKYRGNEFLCEGPLAGSYDIDVPICSEVGDGGDVGAI